MSDPRYGDEPSMAEILASVRRIVAEDQTSAQNNSLDDISTVQQQTSDTPNLSSEPNTSAAEAQSTSTTTPHSENQSETQAETQFESKSGERTILSRLLERQGGEIPQTNQADAKPVSGGPTEIKENSFSDWAAPETADVQSDEPNETTSETVEDDQADDQENEREDDGILDLVDPIVADEPEADLASPIEATAQSEISPAVYTPLNTEEAKPSEDETTDAMDPNSSEPDSSEIETAYTDLLETSEQLEDGSLDDQIMHAVVNDWVDGPGSEKIRQIVREELANILGKALDR